MSPSSKRWSFIATENSDGSQRLDKYLSEKIESGEGHWSTGEPLGCSRTRIQSLIEEGRISLNEKTVTEREAKKIQIREGDRIVIEMPIPTAISLEPENIALDILYQDEHIVVINKPPGLTVHPSETQHTGTLVHALLHHIKDLSGIGGELRPGIVHRLDKDTSGALVVTKTDLAHQRLVETFSKHDLERRYWALCYGSPAKLSTEHETKTESLIDRNPNDRKKMSMDVTTGRHAITWFKKMNEYRTSASAKPFASWIEARLETGRTHQVRVHLHGMGHSVLGDPVYGTPTVNQPKLKQLPKAIQELVQNLPGQALHARTLGFHHPITQKWLYFEAVPPPAFTLLFETLEKDYAVF